MTPEQLAQKFHETYEQLAPEHGYKTRKESAKPWSEVPENNKNLMIAVCTEIDNTVIEPLKNLIAEMEAWALTIAPHSYLEGDRAKALREQVHTLLKEEE